ncbi:hypothetical protein OW715_12080 [Acidithiobacillus ferriphilus]|uniref:Uncharacterized protein n=1 Tax=Acidithiobacillus ferrooxidans TaxID=920 RepID=A0A179BPS1_ACIFR|nr:hypothetical protein [Acidithiobacillus ferriphilus]OAP93285.1 hypothetical protein A4H96_00665 [Acidithiobacillus ferrooxidans]
MGFEQLLQLMAVIRLKALALIGAAMEHDAAVASAAKFSIFDSFMCWFLPVSATFTFHINAKTA